MRYVGDSPDHNDRFRTKQGFRKFTRQGSSANIALSGFLRAASSPISHGERLWISLRRNQNPRTERHRHWCAEKHLGLQNLAFVEAWLQTLTSRNCSFSSALNSPSSSSAQ